MLIIPTYYILVNLNDRLYYNFITKINCIFFLIFCELEGKGKEKMYILAIKT